MQLKNVERDLYAAAGAGAAFIPQSQIDIAKKGIQDQIALLKERTDAANESSFQRAFQSGTSGLSAEAQAPGLTPEQVAANNALLLAKNTEFINAKLAADKQLLTSELANAATINDKKLQDAEFARIL